MTDIQSDPYWLTHVNLVDNYAIDWYRELVRIINPSTPSHTETG